MGFSSELKRMALYLRPLEIRQIRGAHVSQQASQPRKLVGNVAIPGLNLKDQSGRCSRFSASPGLGGTRFARPRLVVRRRGVNSPAAAACPPSRTAGKGGFSSPGDSGFHRSAPEFIPGLLQMKNRWKRLTAGRSGSDKLGALRKMAPTVSLEFCSAFSSPIHRADLRRSPAI